MNVQIITSSYPAFKGDPGGTAGLFVQSFASELAAQGHTVIVQPIARKQSYQTEAGVVIEPIPWWGGDQELASMNFFNPFNCLIFLKFFCDGKKCTQAVHQKYNIDRTLCMWIIPCGIFGYWIKKKLNKEYDVWALGSDVWKVRKIPFLGKYWIKKIAQNATGVFADGLQLAGDVKEITQKDCQFLPSTRQLPEPEGDLVPFDPVDTCHMLFVGRYHKNKGPDLLIEAIAAIKREERASLKVHFFGAGPLESSLKEMCTRFQLNDIITINGPINDQTLSNYLSRVSFLIIPSRIESIPLIFSDAMQVNTPVISTPVGDLTKLVTNNQCGLVCEEIRAQSLAKSIQKAIELNKNYFKKEQLLKMSKQFNITNIACEWLSS